jgi:transcriptional regulator of aromatic amino acid metabolism
MSNQQVPKNDRARITVFSRLRPHFTLIDSLILSNEAFPTGVLEGLADELDYGMPGYYSEEAQATYAALAEVQNNHVKEADKQLQQQQQRGYNKNYASQAQLDAQQYEQQIMLQQQLYYQQYAS